MGEKTVSNVQQEADSLNGMLAIARTYKAYEGMPVHNQSIVNTVHNELCSLTDAQRRDVVEAMTNSKASKVSKILDGSNNPIALNFDSVLILPLDCKK